MAALMMAVAPQLPVGAGEWTAYDETERIKVVRFKSVSTVVDVLADLGRAWRRAVARYERPLVQVRAALPLPDEDRLLAAVSGAAPPGARAWVAGRIPFRADGEDVALYTVQVEAQGRPSYVTPDSVDHAAALSRGYAKRPQIRPAPPPEGI